MPAQLLNEEHTDSSSLANRGMVMTILIRRPARHSTGSLPQAMPAMPSCHLKEPCTQVMSAALQALK